MNSKASIREALQGGSNDKSKVPPVADGSLSVTPDTPEVVEWRSRSALDPAETSTYLDDEHDEGPKPHMLYGKFTWKIENFSETSKRELRSNVFDVGGYKWYILVYPQGCDVCNHLSLFLCVADYDKLLPGWSHFAQFTIAVVNKDPKKSKYSDTLHRFCKKEHDWGWKKFMELSKVLDGFTVADTLVIKAQVQVIMDKPSRPFRCLDPQYRHELVRVYLTNVEGVCRRFCEDKRLRLLWAKEETMKFKDFWTALSSEQQRKLLTEKGESICKGVVKQFFNEKEVTSTLVMDALYSGCKQIEEHSRLHIEGKSTDGAPMVLIKADKNMFTLHGDLMDIAERACKDFIPAAKDDNVVVQSNDGLALRSGQEEDYRRDSIERDEKRLAELGRRTVEMYVLSHIFAERLENSYREAEALKRQDLLIAEEFEQQKSVETKLKAQAEKEKEKKAKKKEKAKVKKDAEQAKKDTEDAERKRVEDLKRAELDRKAAETAAAEAAVEKMRLEEEQARTLLKQQQAQAKAEKQAATAAIAAAAAAASQQAAEAAASRQAAEAAAARQAAEAAAAARRAAEEKAAAVAAAAAAAAAVAAATATASPRNQQPSASTLPHQTSSSSNSLQRQGQGAGPAIASMHSAAGSQSHARPGPAASGPCRGHPGYSSNRQPPPPPPAHPTYPSADASSRNAPATMAAAGAQGQADRIADTATPSAESPLPDSNGRVMQQNAPVSRGISYPDGPNGYILPGGGGGGGYGGKAASLSPRASGYGGTAASPRASSKAMASSTERGAYVERGLTAGSSGSAGSDLSAPDQKLGDASLASNSGFQSDAGMRMHSGYDAQGTQSPHHLLRNGPAGLPPGSHHRVPPHGPPAGVHTSNNSNVPMPHGSLSLIRTASASVPGMHQQQQPSAAYAHHPSMMTAAHSNGVSSKGHAPEAPHSSRAGTAHPNDYFGAHDPSVHAGNQPSHHGMAGLLHSSSSSQQQQQRHQQQQQQQQGMTTDAYGLSSYRNATAGPKQAAAAAAAAAAVRASGGSIRPPPPHLGSIQSSTLSNGMGPSHSQVPGASSMVSAAQQQQVEDSGSGGAGPTTPVSRGPHLNHAGAVPPVPPVPRGPHLNHAAAEFTGGPSLMGLQPQQTPAPNYSSMQSKQQQPMVALVDSPGLDDFAHMRLIDDLLTE